MTTNLNRRQFLSGDFQARRTVLRPPWAIPVEAFQERCTGCGDCIHACPTNVLAVDDIGLAAIDFSRGECTFCGECVLACTTGALQRSRPRVSPWNYSASIEESCFAQRGVLCSSCFDACANGAILLLPRISAPPLVAVDIDECTGCGACVATCPADAIQVLTRTQINKPSHVEA